MVQVRLAPLAHLHLLPKRSSAHYEHQSHSEHQHSRLTPLAQHPPHPEREARPDEERHAGREEPPRVPRGVRRERTVGDSLDQEAFAPAAQESPIDGRLLERRARLSQRRRT